MERHPAAAFINGAVAGTVIALGLAVWFTAFVATETVTAVELAPGVAQPVFVATATSMWLLVVVVSFLGGLALTGLAYGIGRILEPEARRFPLRYLIPIGVILSIVLGFAATAFSVTVAGDISIDGIVTIPVGTMFIIAGIAGLVVGTITVPVVDALARPAVVGGNEALPASARDVWTDMARAVGVPLIAVIIIVLLAVSLAQVLLNSPSPTVSVAVFALVATAILGGTTALALRPWDRNGTT